MTDSVPVRGSLALRMRALERAQPLSACLELAEKVRSAGAS